MKNRIIILILSLALLVSVSFNIYQLQGIKSNKDQQAALQTQLDQKVSDIEGVSTQLADLETDLTALQQSLTDKQTEYDTLLADHEALKVTASDLEEKMKQAEEARAKAEEEAKTQQEDKKITSSSNTNANDPSVLTPEGEALLQELLANGGSLELKGNSLDYSNAAPADGTHYGDIE